MHQILKRKKWHAPNFQSGKTGLHQILKRKNWHAPNFQSRQTAMHQSFKVGSLACTNSFKVRRLACTSSFKVRRFNAPTISKSEDWHAPTLSKSEDRHAPTLSRDWLPPNFQSRQVAIHQAFRVGRLALNLVLARRKSWETAQRQTVTWQSGRNPKTHHYV